MLPALLLHKFLRDGGLLVFLSEGRCLVEPDQPWTLLLLPQDMAQLGFVLIDSPATQPG